MAKAVKVEEQPFRVPSLSESDAEYAAIAERLAVVEADAGKTSAEIRALEADLRQRPALRGVRSGVAALVGDVIETDERPAKLPELKNKQRDHSEAAEMLRKRLADRRGVASVAACNAVKAEYASRVAALCKTLEEVQKARTHLEELLQSLEAEDIAWSRLGVFRTPWLGDRIPHFIEEARRAGYVE